MDGFALEISKPDDSTVAIEWESQGVTDYEVWSSTDPYFEPGDPGSLLVTTTTDLVYATTTAWESYYRVVAPGAAEELSTTVGHIRYDLYAGYTKLGVCLLSEVDHWPELQADMASAPSNAFMWDAALQQWVYGWFLNEVEIDPGEVVSVLHDAAPDPSNYSWVGHVPTQEDVSITLLPGDNLVTTVPLRFGPIMTSDLLSLVDSATRIGSWDPVTQTTRWHPEDGDWLLPTCSPVHVEVTEASEWPPPASDDGGEVGSASASAEGASAEDSTTGTTTTTTSASAGGDAGDENGADADDGSASADDGSASADDGSASADDGGDDLPPDPADVAPPLDTTVVTRLYDAVSFLFEGDPPIQEGVAPGTIEERRVAVLRGFVGVRDGAALGGVEISVLRHPEYGTTRTRADGRYDMAVNGGEPLVLSFAADDMLPAQRTVEPGWQEYAEVDAVALVALDAEVSIIDFQQPIEMHVASSVSDADGNRTAVLMFRDETVATMVMPDASTSELDSFSVHATEYTVGPQGPDAMPGDLPPASAYTYAVEYTIEEAEAAGAVRVDLDPPAIAYVENFVGFPVGGPVPLGSYDPQSGAWIASPNGNVIEVAGVNGGLADVDLTGDGVAESAAALAAIGMDDDERAAIASQYTAGTELWRMSVPHMSSWDANWPGSPPDDAESPPPDSPPDPQPDPDPSCLDPGSIVECDGQVLGEELPIAGTPFTLAYRSDRVVGRAASYRLQVPIADATWPNSLDRVQVQLDIAGRHFVETIDPEPYEVYEFDWDGFDAFDRRPQGPVPVHACVFYDYPVDFSGPATGTNSAFGYNGNGNDIVGERASSIISFRQCHKRRPVGGASSWFGMSKQAAEYALGVFDARVGAPALGGWTLSPHHTLAPEAGIVFLGNGDKLASTYGVDPIVITRIAGGGSSSPGGGDEGPALDASISSPICSAVGPDGSVYVCDGTRIRRIDPEGIIHNFAGSAMGGFAGDGGPATAARLNSPRGVDVGPDGSVYIADSLNRRIRRVDPSGIITTFAGNGALGVGGDDGPATAAQLSLPTDVAVAPDGTVYVAQGGNSGRIRRIGADGTITRFAGGGVCGAPDGSLARNTCLQGVEGIAITDDGTLYLTYRTSSTAIDRIYRIDRDGRMWFVSGAGSETPASLEEDLPASGAWLDHLRGIDVANGFVYLADSGRQRVRYIDPSGEMHTLAGNGLVGSRGDGGPARQARLSQPAGVSAGLDGSVYFTEFNGGRVRRLSGLAPGFSSSDLLVPSRDGSQVWVFDEHGRHLRTHHGLTSAILYTFDYDTHGHLVAITDAYGAVTQVVRDAEGVATAIVGPDGHETTLEIGTSGYLDAITNPANETYAFEYTARGLLTAMIAPGDELHTFEYDDMGRLVLDTDAEDGSVGLSRTGLGPFFFNYLIEVTTALGRTKSIEHYGQTYSGQETTIVTLPDGTRNSRTARTDATEQYTFADGTVTRREYLPDSRFGMFAPTVRSETETPSGLLQVHETQRVVTLAEDSNLLAVTSVEETATRNGRTAQRVYDAATDTWTVTTAAGRDYVVTLDEQARPTRIDAPGLESVFIDYDARGRVETTTMGLAPSERIWSFAYDAAGNLASTEDPSGRISEMTHDPVGRVLEVLGPDLETTELGYDDRGNLTRVTPPDRTVHELVYDGDDRRTGYVPPDLGAGNEATQYVYDQDDALALVQRPNGQVISFDYDAAGRLEAVIAPHGTLSVTYDLQGRVEEVEAPEGSRIIYVYDGRLLTRTDATGPWAGVISWTYDNDFRVASETIQGETFEYDYDADGLLTAAGAVTIARDPTGFPNAITAGTLSTELEFDTFGALTGMASATGPTALLSFAYEHDALGRIVSITETLGAATTVTEYGYDDASRLESVTVDGLEQFTYAYDGNGNRTSVTSGAGTVTASFDAHDRLVQVGTIELEYALTGELLSRNDGGAITQYEHDAFGALRAVELPNGTLVEYDVDARGRRVGRRIDGALDRGWLYDSQLDPVAELDADGDVVSRFVYGSLPHTPDLVLRDGNTYRVLTDHVGSVRMVVDIATGVVAQELQYSPWGEVLLDTNPGFQPFGFAGGIQDSATGLVNFGAREYDPGLGRWISRDPALFTGGMNLFAYASNDPVNLHDPDGRKPTGAPLPGGPGPGTGLPGPTHDPGPLPPRSPSPGPGAVLLPFFRYLGPFVTGFCLGCPSCCGVADPEPDGFCEWPQDVPLPFPESPYREPAPEPEPDDRPPPVICWPDGLEEWRRDDDYQRVDLMCHYVCNTGLTYWAPC